MTVLILLGGADYFVVIRPAGVIGEPYSRVVSAAF